MTDIFAAAGIAEAAWAMAACEMYLVLGLIAVLTLFALVLRSRRLSVTTVVLLLFATLLYQPWHLFSPFEEMDYADPDVLSAAEMFQTLGVAWVVIGVASLGSLVGGFFFLKANPPPETPWADEPGSPVAE